MSTQRTLRRLRGTDWLANAALDPARARRSWRHGGLAAIPAGPWDVAEAGLARSVDAMQRIPSTRLGPVLAHLDADLAWWLLPPGTGDELTDMPTVIVHPQGWTLWCPPSDRCMQGRVWLERPDGSGRLTHPTVLGAAFGPGSHRVSAEADE